MKQTLTPEKLVLYVYDEISNAREREQIKQAIRDDNQWYELYNDFTEIRDAIDNSGGDPSDEIISHLLDYSKALNVIQMSDHRTLGLVMN